MIKKPPAAIVDLEFGSNHLNKRHVTILKIRVKLKTLDFCKKRIFKYTPITENHPCSGEPINQQQPLERETRY